MKYKNAAMALGLACAATFASAETKVLTFEDVPATPYENAALSDYYADVQSSSGWVSDFWLSSVYGSPLVSSLYGQKSLNVEMRDLELAPFLTASYGAGLQSFQHKAEIEFKAAVVFESAAFDPFNLGVYQLFNGSTLVYTSEVIANGAVNGLPPVLVSGYTGAITRVAFYLDAGGDGAVIDNVTYSTITAVPEPESYALLLAGLGLLAGVARRKASAKKLHM